jgi:hypothetical protein
MLSSALLELVSALRQDSRRRERILDIVIAFRACPGMPGPRLAVTLRRIRRLWAAFANAFSSAPSCASSSWLSVEVHRVLSCEQSASGKKGMLHSPPQDTVRVTGAIFTTVGEDRRFDVRGPAISTN